MHPSLPRFELLRPASVSEAGALLAEHGDHAVAMCGGTELLLLLKLGLARPEIVVDLKQLPELARLERDGDVLAVGAATTHRRLEASPLVRETFPALSRMEYGVANVRVRSAGTIGGNVAFADPHSDVLTFLAVTDTDAVLDGVAGRRTLPLAELVYGPYETALLPGELLTELRVPLPGPTVRVVHHKLAFHERPAVTVTCALDIEGGVVTGARVGVGSVGPRVVRVEAAAELAGMRAAEPEEDRVRVVADTAAEVSGAVADPNGSADYKRALVATLVRRTVAEALAT